ncbi:uncharacterized protein LOC109862986 [Pseudomyrmex gracilis]|uniref:uncharacterized protein LOC109862986 n=1 Tax=Pseudomyrmex gracilis TaxID=219809 RepID=UPI000995DDCE|nr:uncharacterized protein LOC109862986 [Pseudomyrmex gracilis]
MVRRWRRQLEDPSHYGQRVREALGPVLKTWLECPHIWMTYRSTQIVTGHGVFGEFLHRIQKANSPECEHCGAEIDTATHTLEECEAWESERAALLDAFGDNISLPSIFRQAVEDINKWRTFLAFCEKVQSAKEDAERLRQDQPAARRRRRVRS